MNTFNSVVQHLDDDVYEELQRALVTGFWKNGQALTSQQQQICEEAVAVRRAFDFAQPETNAMVADHSQIDNAQHPMHYDVCTLSAKTVQ